MQADQKHITSGREKKSGTEGKAVIGELVRWTSMSEWLDQQQY